MKIAAIGRTEILFDTIKLLISKGFDVPLIITSKEAPEYNKTSKDFENLANEINATFIHTAKINSHEILNEIKKIEPIDICVSINYSGIFEQEIIDLFKIGILNAHMGDLPRYRGNACQAWAIINGEKKMGLCVYKMIGGYLDGGDIIAREYMEINTETTITDSFDFLKKHVPMMFLKSINILEKNPSFLLENTLLSKIDDLRCYPRLPSDNKIDWNKSNIEIIRLINASTYPFSGAFTTLREEKLIIWEAKLLTDSENYLAIPGQISMINEDGSVDVITGNNKIKLLKIEYQGHIYNKPSLLLKSIRYRLV
jgi:methionyl-tRNA formyltransferase